VIMLKDREKFISGEGVCYIPDNAEYEDDKYTKQDILEVCYNNQDLAELVFDLLTWQHPSTMIEELKRDILDSPSSWGLDRPPESVNEVEQVLKNFSGEWVRNSKEKKTKVYLNSLIDEVAEAVYPDWRVGERTRQELIDKYLKGLSDLWE